MRQSTLKKIVAFGVLTGMRSMAGMAALSFAHRRAPRRMMALAAAGEMIADKTSRIGNRIEPLPLTARTIIGAGIGALIGGQQDDQRLLGGLLGATTAFVAAHLAYYARQRVPLSPVAGGLVEDGLVVLVAIASRYA